MPGLIAVIGYGSLIWDLDDLASKVEGDWRLGAGPEFPLEFSHISSKRLGSLTVVIDPQHGELCRTAVIASARSTVAEAAQDLAEREWTTTAEIGWVDTANGASQSRNSNLHQDVARWCAEMGWRGAVWTDMAAVFASIKGEAFSVSSGLTHLRSLKGESLREAVRYITYAPAETNTPLRRTLAADSWWRSVVEEQKYDAAGDKQPHHDIENPKSDVG